MRFGEFDRLDFLLAEAAAELLRRAREERIASLATREARAQIAKLEHLLGIFGLAFRPVASEADTLDLGSRGFAVGPAKMRFALEHLHSRRHEGSSRWVCRSRT